MIIQYPTDLDTLTNPAGTDSTVTVDHASQHSNENDAIEALEAKVGKDGSAVTTSHDFKLSGVTTGDKAVSLTGTEDLTNKSLKTGTKITLGSDATGDIYYRHTDGTLKRLPADEGKILKIASGVPTYATEAVTVDASTVAKGIAEEATLAEIDANTAAGGTSARLFVNPSTLGKTIDGTFADNSDAKIPSQKAIKTYVDTYGWAGYAYTSTAGDVLLASTDAELGRPGANYIKVRETVSGVGGVLRIKFSLRYNGTGTAYGRIYRNGVAVGTERSTDSGTLVEFSEDISGWKRGDLIQLYCKGTSMYYANFRIYSTYGKDWTANL